MTQSQKIVWKDLVSDLLYAVSQWKKLVLLVKDANKRNDNVDKKILTTSMFFWRKQAEKFMMLEKQLRLGV